jgi:hypothetical protein
MTWYRTKLRLETDNPDNFQPIFEKWADINMQRSLLKVFLPLKKGQSAIKLWGNNDSNGEKPLQEEGFFLQHTHSTPPHGAKNLEALFAEKGMQSYIGFRRLSCILKEIRITVFDPDVDPSGSRLIFLNGDEISGSKTDWSMIMLCWTKALSNQSIQSGCYPWIPTSAENPLTNAEGKKCYWDLRSRNWRPA